MNVVPKGPDTALVQAGGTNDLNSIEATAKRTRKWGITNFLDMNWVHMKVAMSSFGCVIKLYLCVAIYTVQVLRTNCSAI